MYVNTFSLHFLDDLRHQFEGLDSLLSHSAQQIQLETPQTVATELNVVYFPQIGYLIAVDIENNNYGENIDKETIGIDIGWEYQVSVFLKNFTKDLNQMIQLNIQFMTNTVS